MRLMTGLLAPATPREAQRVWDSQRNPSAPVASAKQARGRDHEADEKRAHAEKQQDFASYSAHTIPVRANITAHSRTWQKVGSELPGLGHSEISLFRRNELRATNAQVAERPITTAAAPVPNPGGFRGAAAKQARGRKSPRLRDSKTRHSCRSGPTCSPQPWC
jgi:hypothetical protein